MLFVISASFEPTSNHALVSTDFRNRFYGILWSWASTDSMVVLSICFFPGRCLQPVTQPHYAEGPLVPLIALVVPGHGFETPMGGTTVMAPSEPSCPPQAALGLGWCQEPGGQSVQGLPVVWGCLVLSLQPALGA